MSQVRPKGRLRIDLSAPLAQLVVIPALSGFFDRYPDIQIDIGASDRATDLIAENVDCVLRAGILTDQSLIARRIADLHMITCAAPSYLARHGTPTHPNDLQQDHSCVTYLSSNTGRPYPFEFHKGPETLELACRARAAVNEAGTYVVAAIAGHGVAQIPYFMVQPHLQTGALRRVLADWTVPALPLHVVYAPNRHLSTKLRVFVDWVADLFATSQFAAP